VGSKKQPAVYVCEICANEVAHVVTVGDATCVVARAVNQWEWVWANVQVCNGCKFDNKNFKKPEGWLKG